MTDVATGPPLPPPPEPAPSPHHTLEAVDVTLAYDKVEVATGLTVSIPAGKITCIVGANACGKSTLLRALARLLKPSRGQVLLDGQSIHRMPTRKVATTLGILPQTPTAPDGITVADLVSRGRYPHQRWYSQWNRSEEDLITEAMAVTGTLDLADRSVDELSGGQRQRAWIAMALAQETDLMLLDEPTTYLDLAHQVEVLDLLVDLNRAEQRTIVLVLHDLNQASRYSHHLIAMGGGRIVAEGPPAQVITEALVQEVFDLRCRVVDDPVSGTPMVVPIGRHLDVADETPGAMPAP
jgi:iron complex transport system ATP-binding protein